jgi:uncharacterized protein (TIGR00369 family)
MDLTADGINQLHRGTWAGELGLTLVTATRDEVIATIPLTAKHRQPAGIVHGGVYASIVETVASCGAAIDALAKGKTVVGLDNQTSFIRATREGTLTATGTPVTRGRRTQLWDVVIRDDGGQTIATGRVRLLVVEPETIP